MNLYLKDGVLILVLGCVPCGVFPWDPEAHALTVKPRQSRVAPAFHLRDQPGLQADTPRGDCHPHCRENPSEISPPSEVLITPPHPPMIFSAPHGKLRCSTYQGETNILELLDFSSGRRSDLSVVCQITYRLGLVWRFCTVCLNNMWSAVSVCQSNPVQKSNTRRKQTRKQKTTHIPVGKAGSWRSRRPVNQQLEITALRWVQTPHQSPLEANSPITGSTKGD